MRIALIYPEYKKLLVSNLDPPLNLIMVAESLENYDTRVVDLRITKDIPPAEIYGFTASTPGYPQMVEVMKKIKRENPEAKSVIGGVHATVLPEQCLHDGFDKVFAGECEITLPEVLRNWDKAPPLVRGELPQDLPPYEIHKWVDKAAYIRSSRDVYTLMLSRGCPFKCRYCASTRISRKMALENVIKTISSLGQIEGLRFMDENFLSDKRWFSKITEYLSTLSIPYFIFCRAEDLNDEIVLEKLCSSNCKVVSVGFETGSQRLHNFSTTGKNVQKMMSGLKRAAEAGLEIRLNLIVGLPGETWDTVKETVEKVNQLKFASFSLNHFVPYPGTYWYCTKNHMLRANAFSNSYCIYGENMGYQEKEEISAWREYMLEHIKGTPHSKVSGKGLL